MLSPPHHSPSGTGPIPSAYAAIGDDSGVERVLFAQNLRAHGRMEPVGTDDQVGADLGAVGETTARRRRGPGPRRPARADRGPVRRSAPDATFRGGARQVAPHSARRTRTGRNRRATIHRRAAGHRHPWRRQARPPRRPTRERGARSLRWARSKGRRQAGGSLRRVRRRLRPRPARFRAIPAARPPMPPPTTAAVPFIAIPFFDGDDLWSAQASQVTSRWAARRQATSTATAAVSESSAPPTPGETAPPWSMSD